MPVKRVCSLCEKEFVVPENMPNETQCYPCWDAETERCFPTKKMSISDILTVIALIGAIIVVLIYGK